jgi:hypothetical protein
LRCGPEYHRRACECGPTLRRGPPASGLCLPFLAGLQVL